jgi:hypothetical protein
MKRIIATILAGGLSALTLAAAPAHADEGRGNGRDGEHQQYDRAAPPPPRYQRRDRDARDQRDEDAYRGDYGRQRDEHAYRGNDGRRYDGYPRPYRRAGDVDVHIDVNGGWLAHR